MTSSNRMFDHPMIGDIALTPAEMLSAMVVLRGGARFHCHALPRMTGNAFHNIGLEHSFSGFDE